MKKETKGITLIALVITIIVLLILVGIAITMLTGENSILKRAGDAKNEQTIASEKELIKLGYDAYIIDKSTNSSAELKVQDADVEGSEEEGGWTITFSKTTGNVYILDSEGNITKENFEEEIEKIRAGYKKYEDDKSAISQQIEAKRAEMARREEEAQNNANTEDLNLLIQYCIGNNDKDLINDVLNLSSYPYKFKGYDPIPNADEELTFINIGQEETDEHYIIYIYFSYKDNLYNLVSWMEVDEENETRSYPTKEVKAFVDNSDLENEISSLTNEINNLELSIEGATVKQKDQDGWEIKFDETEHAFTLSLDGNSIKKIKYMSDLEIYFLGENGEGKKWDDLKDYRNNFKNDSDSISDALTSLKQIGRNYYQVAQIPTEDSQGIWDYVLSDTYSYVEYKNIVYKISLVDRKPKESESDFYTTKIEKFYQKNGAEGTKVLYSTDGTSDKIEWMVLYDNGETVDIVSLDSIGNFTLGSGDVEATNDTGNSNETLGKCINSYNNAIERMNNYCKSLITNPTAKKVRSFGTKPDFSTDTSKMFYSNRTIDWYKDYNGIFKMQDSNSEQDSLRVSYYNILSTGKDYWIARRIISPVWRKMDGEDKYSTLTSFKIAYFENSFNGEKKEVFANVYKNGGDLGSGTRSYTKSVRPVVRVNKSDVGL